MASLTAQREQTAALDDAHIDLLTTTAYSVANVRAMEQPLLAKGVPLMRMAARATAHKILQIIEDAPLDRACRRGRQRCRWPVHRCHACGTGRERDGHCRRQAAA